MRDGKGGFIDTHAYRTSMTDIVWHGKTPQSQQTEESRVQAAKEAVGKPTPQDVLAEARAMFESAKERNPPKPKDPPSPALTAAED